MTDRWQDEVVLQRIHGLSPSEAHLYTAKANGIKVVGIADSEGMSENTVRTILRRADIKMKAKNTKKKSFVIVKGNLDDNRSGLKYTAIRIVAEFLKKALGCTVYEGKSSLLVSDIPADRTGDVGWMNDNIFSQCSIVGMYESEIKERAERLYKAMDKYPESDVKVGWGCLKYQLESMYMKYDEFEESD